MLVYFIFSTVESEDLKLNQKTSQEDFKVPFIVVIVLLLILLFVLGVAVIYRRRMQQNNAQPTADPTNVNVQTSGSFTIAQAEHENEQENRPARV